MVNKGKKFESIIERDFNKMPDAKITRLYDPVGGYYGIRNVCDFIGYRFPYSFYIEAKETQKNTYSLDKLSQYESLLQYRNIKGIFVGVLVWFFAKQKVVWCSIDKIVQLGKQGAKSININIPDTYDFEVESTTSRIYPVINFDDLYNKLDNKFKGLV